MRLVQSLSRLEMESEKDPFIFLNVLHTLSLTLITGLITLHFFLASKNYLVTLLCGITALMHIFFIASWAYDDDPVAISQSPSLCWTQALGIPYSGLAMHILVFATVFNLWLLLRGKLLKIKPWVWSVVAVTLPIIPVTIMALIVHSKGGEKGISAISGVVCSVATPRAAMLLYAVPSLIMMIPMIFIPVHLIVIIIRARRYGSDIVTSTTVTLPICIRMITMAIIITFYCAIVDVWILISIIGNISNSVLPLIPLKSEVTSGVYDYTVASLGIVWFLIFGTSYEVTMCWMNPLRRLFGMQALPASPRMNAVSANSVQPMTNDFQYSRPK